MEGLFKITLNDQNNTATIELSAETVCEYKQELGWLKERHNILIVNENVICAAVDLGSVEISLKEMLYPSLIKPANEVEKEECPKCERRQGVVCGEADGKPVFVCVCNHKWQKLNKS